MLCILPITMYTHYNKRFGVMAFKLSVGYYLKYRTGGASGVQNKKYFGHGLLSFYSHSVFILFNIYTVYNYYHTFRQHVGSLDNSTKRTENMLQRNHSFPA